METVDKWVLIGGHVKSRVDGQTHWVSARILMDLYRLKPHECILVDGEREGYKLLGFSPDTPKGWLYPREDGDYTLPSEDRTLAKRTRLR